MKKIASTIITCICFTFLNAQSSNDSFAVYLQTVPGSSLQFKMVPIRAGNFLMGSPDTEKDRKADEGPQRNITISPFWMGAFEMSRDAFDVFYTDATVSQTSTVDAVTRPTAQYIDLTWGMGKEGGYPVNSMSQYAALMYCRWLYVKTGIFYRLPSEAEWEYACRAGTTTAYYFGDDASQLGKYAWFKENSKNKYQKAGQKLPNAWGLYDMLGNVAEWTLDHYDEKVLEKITDKAVDPFPEPNNAHYPKSLRGGGFADDASQLRSANRIKSETRWNRRDPQIPKSKWWLTDAASVGFRIVRPLKQPSKEEIEDFFKKYLPRQ